MEDQENVPMPKRQSFITIFVLRAFLVSICSACGATRTCLVLSFCCWGVVFHIPRADSVVTSMRSLLGWHSTRHSLKVLQLSSNASWQPCTAKTVWRDEWENEYPPFFVICPKRNLEARPSVPHWGRHAPSSRWLRSALPFHLYQEIIKVKDWIPHIGLIPKIVLLKLLLDVVPSSSPDVTRTLRGCFRGGFAYVSFLFVSPKRGKTSNALGISLLLFFLGTNKWVSAVAMF